MNTNQYLPDYINDPQTNNEALTGKTFDTITCDTGNSAKVGVTCGKGTYTIAFELFFNTMLGNRYMFDHLDQFNNCLNSGLDSSINPSIICSTETYSSFIFAACFSLFVKIISVFSANLIA